MSVKRVLSNLVSTLPDNGRAARQLYHRFVNVQRKRDVARREKEQRWHLPSPDAQLTVSPERIRLITEPTLKPTPDALVMAGDWDVGGAPIEATAAYRSIHQRIANAVAWQETELWRTAVSDVAQGKGPWGCRDEAALNARFQELDAMIARLRGDGSAAAPAARDADGDFAAIQTHISRDGGFRLHAGLHEVSIARALGLPKVSMTIKVRHLEWQKLREYIYTMLEGGGGAGMDGVLYQRPAHPDLQDIPAEHSCNDRLELLLPHLTVRSGRLLDIGCNLGFFCNGFEQQGLECTGIEYFPDIAYAATRIAASEERRYRIVHGNILDPKLHQAVFTQPFDVVLALNIFHHFLKTKEEHTLLIEMLQKLRPQQMFFEAHRADEPQMVGAYANMEAEDFAAFVAKHAGLSRIEYVGTMQADRKVFVLHR